MKPPTDHSLTPSKSTRPPWLFFYRGTTKDAKVLSLSSDACRWAMVCVWDEAKTYGGVFASEAQLKACLTTSSYRHVKELREVGLLEGPDGLKCHEWPEHQDDPESLREKQSRAGQASAAKRRKEHGTAIPPNASNSPDRTTAERPPNDLNTNPERNPRTTAERPEPTETETETETGTNEPAVHKKGRSRPAVGQTELDHFTEHFGRFDDVTSADVERWLHSQGKFDANKDDVETVMVENDRSAASLLKSLKELRVDQKAGQTGKALLHFRVSNQHPESGRLGSAAGRAEEAIEDGA